MIRLNLFKRKQEQPTQIAEDAERHSYFRIFNKPLFVVNLRYDPRYKGDKEPYSVRCNTFETQRYSIERVNKEISNDEGSDYPWGDFTKWILEK